MEPEEPDRKAEGRGVVDGDLRRSRDGGLGTWGRTGGPIAPALELKRTRPFSFLRAALAAAEVIGSMTAHSGAGWCWLVSSAFALDSEADVEVEVYGYSGSGSSGDCEEDSIVPGCEPKATP